MAEFLESAIGIAHRAGSLLRYYFERVIPEKKHRFELKGDFDLVTEADKASEKLVIERLKQNFPDHDIVAEEGGGNEGSSEYRWYVDPVDGTTNFAHGFPVFNVTLALEKAGELVAGVIFDPTRQEMFAKGELPLGTTHPAPSGTLNGEEFTTLEDADPRIGANLEAFIAGSYTWIPLAYVESVEIQAPKKLRDLLWAPAILHTTEDFRLTDLG